MSAPLRARMLRRGLPAWCRLLLTGTRGLTAWCRARVTAASRTLRAVAGMPDYPAYCAHLRAAHPDRPIPTERAYFDDYLRHRYEGGPTRCC